MNKNIQIMNGVNSPLMYFLAAPMACGNCPGQGLDPCQGLDPVTRATTVTTAGP